MDSFLLSAKVVDLEDRFDSSTWISLKEEGGEDEHVLVSYTS